MSEPMFLNIVNAPTTMSNIHQSVYRNARVLDMVRYLLAENTPSQVILRLIEATDALPSSRDEPTQG